EIGRLVPELRRLSDSVLLAGDLNATPWSRASRLVAEAGGLRQIGSPGPTWLYRKLPEALRFAGLPIDQVFARGSVRVHAARALEAAGSAHLPVLVEFSLDTPSPAGQDSDTVRLAAARVNAAVPQIIASDRR